MEDRSHCPHKLSTVLTDNASQFTDRFTSKKHDAEKAAIELLIARCHSAVDLHALTQVFYQTASDKRLAVLRGSRGAARPGHTLVVYDPDSALVCDIVACEDAHQS